MGTPPQAFDVILDTGSSCVFPIRSAVLTEVLTLYSDLWLADASCTTGCSSVPTFEPTSSSSFTNKSTAFSITYGSGQAAGSLGQDVVQMAGFAVQNQVFAVCDEVSDGLLSEPVSGLLGLGFQTIASSGASPLWETLVSNGAWDSPVMAFQLTRCVARAIFYRTRLTALDSRIQVPQRFKCRVRRIWRVLLNGCVHYTHRRIFR